MGSQYVENYSFKGDYQENNCTLWGEAIVDK